CHGELARRRPHPKFLTQFYLMVSAGGAIGGLFVALGAPRWFRGYLELPVALAGCAILTTCVLWNQSPFIARGALVAATIGFIGYLYSAEVKKASGYVLSARNFYGVLRVREDAETEDSPAKRVLIHGTINHGTQLLRPGSERIATSYFGTGSG